MSTTIDKSDEQPDQIDATPEQSADTTTESGISKTALFMSLLVGIYFGIVLTKSEVARWQRIHDMFLFKESQMYLIIGLGVLVAMIAMQGIKATQVKTIDGQPIQYTPKPFHKGVIIGGTLFGAGWAITGACPGPIYAQIGGGEWMAIITLVGALIGMYAYAYAKPMLPH